MLEMLKKQIDPRLSREEKISQVREFLQILILKIIYDQGFFRNLTFTGGTALRIIYDLKRYSEDLDFSLTQKRGYVFAEFHKEITDQLTRSYGFKLSGKAGDQKTVQAVDLKFDELLFKLGLSNQKGQKLYIKIEIDSNPPAGWKTELSLVSRSFVFTVTHFDLASLYATKLHACFFRKFTKGRDLYDLIWYLGKNLLPNFTVLNHAIEQTEHRRSQVSKTNFKDFLLKHLEKINLHAAQEDVKRFLIDKSELKLFNKNLLEEAISSRFSR